MSNSFLEKKLGEIRSQVNLGQWSNAYSLAKIFVKENPTDLDARLTLFALMMMGGEYDRAKAQLSTYFKLGGQNATPDYLILPELFKKREAVLRGEVLPRVIGIEEEEIQAWSKAVGALNDENCNLLESFNARQEETPSPVCLIEEGVLGLYSNSDARFSRYIETVLDGDYTIVAFSEIKELLLPEKPEILIDFIVLPLSMALKNGETKQGFTFTSYPFSHLCENEKAKLSLESVWNPLFDEVDIGLGAQIFSKGEQFLSIFQLNKIRFEATA